jgi:hypothetical protein
MNGLDKYIEWFKPAPIDAILGKVTMFSELKPPESEDEAYLQVVAFSRWLKSSPSQFVQTVVDSIEANPDGSVTKFLAKCYANLQNPLDFLVWLHSPKAETMFAQANIQLNSDCTFEQQQSTSQKLVVI